MTKYPRVYRIIGYLLLFVAIYLRRKPSLITPTIWLEPNPLPKFEGPSAVNEKLLSAKLVTGNFRGAESFAVDDETGDVYASFNDGTIGRFTQNGDYQERVLFIGGFLKHKESNGISYETKDIFRWCNKESLSHELAWNVTGENLCGRPLGLRIHKNTQGKHLYIMDAYHGLFTYDLNKKELVHVISNTTPITSNLPEKDLDPNVLKPSKFFNDLVVLQDGRVVYTDSSFKFSRSENRQEILDGEGRGRLFLYTPAARTSDISTDGRLQVLACGIHFANGIEVVNNDEVIVADLGRFRILQFAINKPFLLDNEALQYNGQTFHNLKVCVGNESETSLYKAIKMNDYSLTGVKIFADSVPGLVDNIRIDQTTGETIYWAALGSKSTQPFSLLWWTYQNTWFREWMGKLVSMRMVEKFLPSYGLVIGYNSDGMIVTSLHDSTGKHLKFLSQATRHPITKDLWLGSHSEGYIAIVPAAVVDQ